MTKISEIVPTATEFVDADWLEIEKVSGDSEKMPGLILMNYVKSKAIVVPVGNDQASAFEFVASDNISDVAAAGTGVRLKSNLKGYEAKYYNNTDEDVNVYPKLGGGIDALGLNVPFVVSPGNGFEFKIYANNIVRSF